MWNGQDIKVDLYYQQLFKKNLYNKATNLTDSKLLLCYVALLEPFRIIMIVTIGKLKQI